MQGNKKCAEEKKCAQGTKNVHEVHEETMGAKCNLLWHIMILNCRVWPYMALYGLVCSYMAMSDLLWSCIAMCGLVLCNIVALYCTFLAVIYLNSFGLVC